MLLGNHPLFQVPQYELVHPLEFAIYAALGVIGGIVSVVFTKLLLKTREWFLRLPQKTFPFQPVAGGLLVGIMALFVPQVLGVGYGYVGDALNGRMTLGIMALLVVLKLVAVTTSYGSGNAGGIFGPSLFLGAMVGATVGSIAHHWLPAHTASPGAYALVGMGTLFAGIVRAPMTSVLMIFETTQDYAVIVPLMISNLVSLFISSRLQKEPIYEALAYQDGIHLPHGASRRNTDARPVSQLLRPAEEVLDASMTVSAALETTAGSRYRSWPIRNSRGVIAVVSRKTIEKAVRQEPAKPLGELSDDITFPHLHADQSPHVALERMGAAGLTLLPVVRRADVHKLKGVVLMHDVLNSYGIGPDQDGTNNSIQAVVAAMVIRSVTASGLDAKG